VAAAEARNLRVAVVNSAKDTRYGENVCASHDGQRRSAFAAERLLDLVDASTPAGAQFSLTDFDVIAIDESQVRAGLGAMGKR